MRATTERARLATAAFALAAALALVAASCSDSDDGDGGAPPASPDPEPTTLTRFDSPPGVHLAIANLAGASGADGSFRSGDRIRVTFRLTKDDGTRWGLVEMVESSALVSGPSFNYQRVLAERTDVVQAGELNSDGSFTYEWPATIPATYLAPYNDTPSFSEGELTGQTLLAGTYTVGMSFVWSYSVEGATYFQVGEATADFRFGGEPTLRPREVTRTDNCNQCHVSSLKAHGTKRRNVALCVLCHTSGAEDANDPAIAGGTPGTTIESRVMFHKIHNGRHLPSVNGVGVDAAGNVIYTVPPKPYVLADSVTGAHDYSHVGFPVFPNRTVPMPRDQGYTALSPTEKATEDLLLTGVTRCIACHGDPDGAGPLGEPAQGDLILAQPTRRSCGACHDDVDWTREYVRNQQLMEVQADDSNCFQCHTPDGLGFYSPLAIEDGHIHPLLDPAYTGATFLDFTTFGGLHLALESVVEAGTSNGDGTLDPGEKVALSLRLQTDAGANFPLAKLAGLSAVIAGPTTNSNLLHEIAIPKSMLSGAQPYTIRVPELVQLEFAGDSTAANGDVFVTARTPHVNLAGALTSVRVRTGTSGGSSLTTASSRAPANFVDVANAAGFARDDFVVLDDGAAGEEYLRIQFVDGNRLWFSSPETPSYKAGTQRDHAAGTNVREVQLATQAPNTFDLDPATGTITELAEFGAGNAVLVTYTTEFVVPDRYPLASNNSPDLDETSGEWTGKALVDGTYRLTLSAYCELDLQSNGEDNFYRYATPGASLDVLVGSAATIEPYAKISSGTNCYACHHDFYYHSSYRGFDSCIACHGNAGAEDRPRYVAANAPDTTGVTSNFRTLLHSIHRGADLDQAATFTVAGAGASAYPDNFSLHDYDDISFPAQPGKTAQCAKCHGQGNDTWIVPPPRDHPTEQGEPVLAWRFTCGACHDSAATSAHFDLGTANGVESCEVCHGPTSNDAVEVVHRAR